MIAVCIYFVVNSKKNTDSSINRQTNIGIGKTNMLHLNLKWIVELYHTTDPDNL